MTARKAARRPRLRRRPDWRSALFRAVEAHRFHQFAWGTHDCAILAADAVLAMTGVDFAAAFRGRYRTALGARRLLRRAGHADAVALAATLFREIPIAFAAAGDLAAVPAGNGSLALGVVCGETIALFAPDGLGALPLIDLAARRRAFKVA